jgi:hypothetical protein
MTKKELDLLKEIMWLDSVFRRLDVSAPPGSYDDVEAKLVMAEKELLAFPTFAKFNDFQPGDKVIPHLLTVKAVGPEGVEVDWRNGEPTELIDPSHLALIIRDNRDEESKWVLERTITGIVDSRK